MKNKKVKRRLDEQAKVFTLVSNFKYCSVFRFTVVLKEIVNKDILEDAYRGSLEKYKVLKVKLQRGLFEYSLVQNDKLPIVFEENKEPIIKKINNKENNDYLIKVMVCKKEIYFDFYHALTDGTSAIRFIKEVIGRYLELKNKNDLEKIYLNDDIIISEFENPYKLAKDYKKINYPFSEGIRIKGNSLENNKVIMNHYEIDLKKLKEISKKYGITITMYMTSLIAYIFYEMLYKTSDKKRPINLCIPISLNKYFEVDVLCNFFSYMFVSLDLKDKKEYTLEDIINIVKLQFESKNKLEKIMGIIKSNSKKINNLVLKCIPLFLKKISFVLGSLKLKKQFSMTVSNVGKIEFEERFEKYIENMYVTLSCDWAERVKCGMNSYGDKFIITFCRNIKEDEFEKRFKDLLKKEKIKFEILS